MEKKSFMGVVVLVAFLVVFAGISQAGGMMHKMSGDEKAVQQTIGNASPEIGARDYGEGVAPPESEFWEALGTGSFTPSEEGKDDVNSPRWGIHEGE